MYDIDAYPNGTALVPAKNYHNNPCTAGYYCLGNTMSAAPTDEALNYGAQCPTGYYCP